MATGTQLKKQLPHKINGFGDHFAPVKSQNQPRLCGSLSLVFPTIERTD
jgi:hypothetical protein